MAFRIGRTLPPAAAPIYPRDIISGVAGLAQGARAVSKFQEELKEHFGVGHCFTVSSGKAALTVILQALKDLYPNRDEVLIPAFTCYSVPSAITRAGLKIRLCDLAPGTFDFDYGQLSAIISSHKEKLLCVVPVHLFGFPADLNRIREIIADDSVIIVEDAAQAMGGERDGSQLGTIGDVGFFSLGRGKALSTVEGGVILTRRDDIAAQLRNNVDAIGKYGFLEVVSLLMYSIALSVLSRPSFFWLPASLPFLQLGETIFDPSFKMRRISSYQAGLACGWERKLREFMKVRSENVRDLQKRLDSAGLETAWNKQCSINGLIRFPVRIASPEKREAILQASKSMGLGIAGSYPDSVDRIPELSSTFASGQFPVAKEYADKILTLPVHPFVTREDRAAITDALVRAHVV